MRSMVGVPQLADGIRSVPATFVGRIGNPSYNEGELPALPGVQ
jgi:hypothetical protein